METGLGFTLHRIHWQLFGSFTFKSECLSDSVRQRMWFAWLRATARRLADEGAAVTVADRRAAT